MKPTVASGSRARAPSSIPRPARSTGTRHTGPDISCTSVSASGVRMRVDLVGMAWVASATMTNASSLKALRNSGVGVFSSRNTASLLRESGPSTTRRFFASSIERERLRKRRDPIAQAVRLAAGSLDDDGGDLAHLLLAHPARRHRRRPEPDAAGHRRRLRVVGDHVLVRRHPDGVEHLLELLAVRPAPPQIYQHEVVVGPAGDEAETALHEPLGHRAGVFHDLL